jgi:hypothetical protein
MIPISPNTKFAKIYLRFLLAHCLSPVRKILASNRGISVIIEPGFHSAWFPLTRLKKAVGIALCHIVTENFSENGQNVHRRWADALG